MSIYLKMMSLGALKGLLAELLAKNDPRAEEVSKEIKRREEPGR